MSAPVKKESDWYGIMGEYVGPDELLAAVELARAAGYRRMEAYSPFPVEGLSELLGLRHTRLPFLVLCGGVLGGLLGFGMQYWMMTIDYPLNIGGRPLNSWPAWIPVTFECTILGAALTTVLGMLGLNGLPMPYHPVFHVPEFGLASRDRFFLCIQSRDPLFDVEKTSELFDRSEPVKVTFVPR